MPSITVQSQLFYNCASLKVAALTAMTLVEARQVRSAFSEEATDQQKQFAALAAGSIALRALLLVAQYKQCSLKTVYKLKVIQNLAEAGCLGHRLIDNLQEHPDPTIARKFLIAEITMISLFTLLKIILAKRCFNLLEERGFKVDGLFLHQSRIFQIEDYIFKPPCAPVDMVNYMLRDDKISTLVTLVSSLSLRTLGIV